MPARSPDPAAVLLLTGAQASGKSTVGRLLAERAGRGAFFDGDVFWQAVVAGRRDMDAHEDPEAVAQLHLRYRALALTARTYAEAGFRTVAADNVYGADVALVRDVVAPLPLVTVALTPSPEAVARRERARGSLAYGGWTDGRDLEAAVREHSGWVRATPADLHHDSTGETAEQTADVLAAWLAPRW